MSTPLPPTSGPEPPGLLERLSERVTSAAGLDKLQGFSASAMFGEVFKRRTLEETEDHLIVGTRRTTPDLAAVDATWPRPWLFFKAFALTAVVYALFVFGWNQFENLNLIPGLIMVGSLAVPMTLLIFFFETNVVRNVSLYQVLRMVLLGGVLSLIVSLFGFRLTNLSATLGAPAAGIIEETGKAAALLLVIQQRRYAWILNGMLFGAAVGTGFAVFESAGYAFRLGVLSANSSEVMFAIIQKRALLSIFGGHTLWTALVGAALWRSRDDRPFDFSMLGDVKFLRVFAVAVAVHMLWNAPFELPFRTKEVALGFVAWVTALSLLQAGLRQVKAAQAKIVPATTIVVR